MYLIVIQRSKKEASVNVLLLLGYFRFVSFAIIKFAIPIIIPK